MKKGVSGAFGSSENTINLEPEPDVSYNKVTINNRADQHAGSSLKQQIGKTCCCETLLRTS